MFPPLIIIFTIFPILSLSQYVEQFADCTKNFYGCSETIQWIGYPFWGRSRPSYCGLPGFELTCRDNLISTIEISNTTFRVLRIDQNISRITLAREDLWNEPDVCLLQHQEPVNTILHESSFAFIPEDFLFLGIYYSCFVNDVNRTPGRNRLNCSGDGGGRISFFDDRSVLVGEEECANEISVPVMRRAFEEFIEDETVSLEKVMREGFPVEYQVDGGACSRCQSSGGACWSGDNSSAPSCLCPDGVSRVVCPNSGEDINLKRKLIIGFGSAGVSVFIMLFVFFLCRRNRKRYYSKYYTSSRNISSYTSSMTDLEKDGTYHGVRIFKYSELEKATNHFDSKNELGDGGFGTVYKGKLRDGRDVAVKRLYENNYKRVEQFMNEVEILAHLRHQNLVSLYGCTTHHSRELLLVYEYIPNGTIADHIHGERMVPGSLTWATRMSIAIETASALAYLHASDVIHRDVKTNNILLDNNFCVKVADFGLSRLFPNDVTHVSTAPQGTPGYVDPEYHECYHLTSKSDVYSFGVVLIELISSKPAVDITRHRHEINLSNMAINKIRNDALHELVDPNIGFESDYEVRKMVTAVAELAFQCLQNERDSRPSMAEVLEALKRIQSGDCNKVKEDALDGKFDDAALLKNHPQTMSPDSVAVTWSTSTISSSSG